MEVRLAQLMCADDRRLQPGESFAVCVCSAEHLPDGPSEPTHRGDPYMRRRKALQHTAGRAAASLALQQLGSATGEIAPGAQGEPIWPAGVTGSISHCWPWSIAVAAWSNGFTIGIDLERVDRLHDFEITGLVCREGELPWVMAGENPHERLVLLFSAKEAIYKALFPVYRQYIDFQQVELSHAGTVDAFTGYVELSIGGASSRQPVVARWAIDGTLVFTYVMHSRISPPTTRVN